MPSDRPLLPSNSVQIPHRVLYLPSCACSVRLSIASFGTLSQYLPLSRLKTDSCTNDRGGIVRLFPLFLNISVFPVWESKCGLRIHSATFHHPVMDTRIRIGLGVRAFPTKSKHLRLAGRIDVQSCKFRFL